MSRLRKVKKRRSLIDACLAMNAAGVNQGAAGNASLRVDGGFLVTPSGVPYDETTPEMIVEVDMEGRWSGAFRPSSEWRMHRDIYRARPEAGGVVHTHPPHATAIACLREPIPAFHYMVAAAGGADIRCADYATFGTEALSRAMLAALEGRRACLLANHGLIVMGATLARALALTIEVESLARQYLIARQVGAPVLLDAEEMARNLELFKTYGAQPARPSRAT